ncbi:PHD finger domain-containing protein [Blastomyces dermatitidis ATCC 18188]|uniref:Transcription factor BYE1 n=1 Tax=Ajellomyces dermatitidis (strain ATCC 18188 / CBS 674.68) TaxID=653446 RepID=F2T1V9_AJEDA|nr:PHD finger domain-containing protein [Blastomyces dermatitidis ATCC 18188]
MADEPRRSGRATKGQHSKNNDFPEMAPSKRKGKTQAKAQKQASNEPTPAPNDEEDEIIRCICGEYEEEEDVERDMICCDKCSAWQHNDCMGLTFPKGQEPAEYFCEQCKPENHKDLLDKMARGEKPWEEAARLRALAAEEKKARRKKGGKRGRKSTRPSDVKSEVGEDGVKIASATPAKETPVSAPPTSSKASPPAPAAELPSHGPPSSQKRKFEEQDVSQREPGPKQKLQRLSTGGQVGSPEVRSPTVNRKQSVSSAQSAQEQRSGRSPSEGAGGPSDLQSVARRNVANALVKLFVEQAALAQQQGTYTMPAGKTKEAVGEPLGLAIELAMYKHLCGGAGEPSEAYKQQMRTILFNVRKNTSLRDSLLVGSISPDALATMSTQDMASKELRQKDDEIKREAERQHIIIQEQGPRIRRTHKGEELIEDDTQHAATESIFSAPSARRDTIPDSELRSAASPTGARSASPSIAHQPEFREYRGSMDRAAGDHRPPSIGTSGGDQRRASGPAFNIQNVWSNVQSPGSAPHDKPFPPAPAPALREVHPGHRAQADAEIDQLLKDEDIDSPPYSPKDFHADGEIWRGKVSMNPVAEFSAAARHVAGADLSGRIPWEQLIPPTLVIDGRIETQLATNYLCGLRFSQTTDVSVNAISPPVASHDNAEFQKLFEYFLQRKRFGVIGKHPFPGVKDTYIVPIEAGQSKKPEFIELLENNTLEDPTPHRTLLVVFVVKSNNHYSPPIGHPTPQEPNYTTASPLTATPGSASNQSQYTPAPAASSGAPPIVPTAVSTSPPSAMPTTDGFNQQQQDHTKLQSQLHPQQYTPASHASASPQNLIGKPAAVQILGPLATSPAVEQLLQQAPNSDVEQLKLIAGILAQNPTAANDYQLLVNKIVENTNGKTQ